MGRRNKSYSKDLHQQAYERLNSMQAFGESRRAAKSEGADRDKPHHRPEHGADRGTYQEHAGRGKGVAARPPERRYSWLPGRVCHGHL